MTQRYRFHDKPTRALDSTGSPQAGADVNRILREGEASAALFAAQMSPAHQGLQMLEEGKRAMAAFKAASAARWGTDRSQSVTQDRARATDARLSPMERFKAASRVRTAQASRGTW